MSNLKLDNNGSQDSLVSSWERPQGDLDGVVVTLTSEGSTPQERTLPLDTTEIIFDHLTAGRAYQISVTTMSGELTSQSTATALTGNTRLLNSGADVLIPWPDLTADYFQQQNIPDL